MTGPASLLVCGIASSVADEVDIGGGDGGDAVWGHVRSAAFEVRSIKLPDYMTGLHHPVRCWSS